MITDGFKISFKHGIDDVDKLKARDFKGIHSTTTGEVYGKAIHRCDGVKCTLHDYDYPRAKRTELSGSLPCYFSLDGTNHGDFTISMTRVAWLTLEYDYGLNLEKAVIENLEVGVNLLLPFSPDKLISNVYAFKTMPFDVVERRSNGPTSIAAIGSDKTVKLYQKANTNGGNGCDPHLMRLEMRYNRARALNNVGIYTASDLFDDNKVCHLVNDLNTIPDHLHLMNQEVIVSTSKEMELVKRWNNTNYITQLRKANKNKYYRERQKVRQIIRHTPTNQYNQFHELLESKVSKMMC